MRAKAQRNVFGEPLEACSHDPLTGFYRDGCCHTGLEDAGSHTVCIEVDAVFLDFSRSRGNDLTTPQPAYRFPGLRPGDRWCLVAARWMEAWRAGCAPPVFLRATHERALETCPLAALKSRARDLS